MNHCFTVHILLRAEIHVNHRHLTQAKVKVQDFIPILFLNPPSMFQCSILTLSLRGTSFHISAILMPPCVQWE